MKIFECGDLIETTLGNGTFIQYSNGGQSYKIAFIDGPNLGTELSVGERAIKTFGRSETPLKRQISRMQYASFEENKNYFEANNFISSFDTTPQACWWLAGWFFGKGEGRVEYHPPIKNDKNKLRGATKHVIFKNPEYANLDFKVGEFFDPYRVGWIQINNEGAYDFFNRPEKEIIVPEEYKEFYDDGKEGKYN
jgi:hypothetical protein